MSRLFIKDHSDSFSYEFLTKLFHSNYLFDANDGDVKGRAGPYTNLTDLEEVLEETIKKSNPLFGNVSYFILIDDDCIRVIPICKLSTRRANKFCKLFNKIWDEKFHDTCPLLPKLTVVRYDIFSLRKIRYVRRISPFDIEKQEAIRSLTTMFTFAW